MIHIFCIIVFGGGIATVHSTPETCLQLERYVFINDPMTWQMARDFCADSYGGDLLVTETDKEYSFIIEHFIQPMSLKTWLGLKYNAVTGSYNWEYDPSLTVALDSWRWNPGEPSNKLLDRCVEVHKSWDGFIGMNDVDCFEPRIFICERVHLPCQKNEFVLLKGQRLLNHVRQTVYVTSVTRCSVLCMRETYCKSFNMYTAGEEREKMCELSDSTHVTNPNELLPSNGCVYGKQKS